MSEPTRSVRRWIAAFALPAMALGAVAGGLASGRASAAGFPDIKVWSLAGAFQDSTRIDSFRCVGLFHGPRADSLRAQALTLSVRFLRDRVAETRPDFGGYRIYRMINAPDSSRAVLMRRYSTNFGSELTWHFSTVDTTTLEFVCSGALASDSIVTFVDPDSSGQYEKVCHQYDLSGRCITPGDSIIRLIPPPGPHDGFRTWYSITYEKKNTTDFDYEDLFIPDTLDNWTRCGAVGKPFTCPNLNSKLRNLAGPVEPTGGPTRDLLGVHVVPNPYRGSEAWDQTNSNEVHFVNLPQRAKIKIFTVAGDLVRTLEHNDPVNDFERWDLQSDSHRQVASGIYIYRVESTVGAVPFEFQSRFIVIR